MPDLTDAGAVDILQELVEHHELGVPLGSIHPLELDALTHAIKRLSPCECDKRDQFHWDPKLDRWVWWPNGSRERRIALGKRAFCPNCGGELMQPEEDAECQE